MSEVPNTVAAGLSDSVARAVGEVQKSQGTLLEGIRKLNAHETDENAHRINEAGSPFRTAVENVAINALIDDDTNATIQKVITSKVATAINATLPGVLEQELKSPVSNLSSVVDEQISRMVDQKIKDGALGDAVTSSIGDAKSTADVAKKTADTAKSTADSAKTTATNAQSVANNAKTTAETAKTTADSAKTTATSAQSTANTAKSTADTALATANSAKSTAEAALPKTGNAASASKLATARSLQVNLASISIASFDGTANKDIGVKGVLAVANGGTGASTPANAISNLGGIPKSGARGQLAGSETVANLNNSQTITATSPDSIVINTTGAVTLTFTPAAANVAALKVICLNAAASTALVVVGASWANNASAPAWGDTGKILILTAQFIFGRVVLYPAHNTQ